MKHTIVEYGSWKTDKLTYNMSAFPNLDGYFLSNPWNLGLFNSGKNWGGLTVSKFASATFQHYLYQGQ